MLRTLEVLLKTHFPDYNFKKKKEPLNIEDKRPARLSRLLAGKIFTPKTIICMYNSITSYSTYLPIETKLF